MSEPTHFPGPEVEVYDFTLGRDNDVRVWLRFNDDTYLSVEFRPDSPFAHDLLELVERHANDRLRQIGARGFRISGFTPAEEEEDGG